MGTFRRRTADTSPSILVGWAAGVVQTWPAESDEVGAPAGAERPLGSAEAVLEVLARADGEDPRSYARRHAADAGAVLALTHRTEAEVLAAALRVPGALSPAAVLDVVHGRSYLRPTAATAPAERPRVALLAS